LSEQEETFWRTFLDARTRHLGDVVNAMPASMNDPTLEATIKEEDMQRKGPTLTRFVIARVLIPTEGYEKGSLVILPYDRARQYLDGGEWELT